MQRRGGCDLGAQVGRGIEQGPALAVGRYGESGLGTRAHPRITGPGEPADLAIAVPLWKAAARRRTENDGGETHQARAEGSEFGWQVAVDLEADADFDESRGRPSHGVSSDLPFAPRPFVTTRPIEG